MLLFYFLQKRIGMRLLHRICLHHSIDVTDALWVFKLET